MTRQFYIAWGLLFIILSPAFAAKDSNTPLSAAALTANKTGTVNDIDDFYAHYESILDKYIDENGLVDYKKLRRYRLELIPQKLEFANLDPKEFAQWPKNEQKAFWINAYNFFAISNVIQNYPIEAPMFAKIWWPENSIVHIEGFYDTTFFEIMGLEYNLNEIEQEILNFKDPNVCFAICKATLSSPRLINEPYRGKTLDKQLDKQIKKHFSRVVGIDIKHENNTIFLSEIFDSSAHVFIDKYSKFKKFRTFDPKTLSALNFIDLNASDEVKTSIEKISPETTVKFQRTDWRYYMHLNEIGLKDRP